MLPSFASQTVTIVRPGSKTSRGSTVPDWDDSQSWEISGCSVQPVSSNLSMEGHVLGIVDGWTAYLPDGSDVQAGDRVIFDEKTFEINGEPRVWTGVTNCSHIQLNLKRWEG